MFPSANIEHATSTEALTKWLSTNTIKESDRVFFYLDAHFPEADFKGKPYDVYAENAVPLQAELEIINKYRPNCNDIIVCDDARIYMIGPFENGNVEWLQVPGGLNFLKNIFDIRRVNINFSEEGYIIISHKFATIFF